MRSYGLILLIALIATTCSRRTSPSESIEEKRLVSTFGSTSSFDIATWNVEDFPKQGTRTIEYLSQMIRDMDVDMIAFQEIGSIASFNQLLDSLPAYDGFASALPSDFLKLAILYKKDLISISDPVQIFTTDSYAFPRPPLVSYIEVKDNENVVFDFTLIVLHLKAFGDADSENRRRDACEKLKIYIDDQILNGPDGDVIVLGDLNDEIDDPPSENVFEVFLNDSQDYEFLSTALLGEASFIGSFNSLIDHILISDDTRVDFNEGDIIIPRLEQEFSGYVTYISDHRPVLARFLFFR